MRNKLIKWIKEKFQAWEYGTCNLRKARRHKRKGNVQFIIWKASEQGHKEDCWINFHSDHWPMFRGENEECCGCENIKCKDINP